MGNTAVFTELYAVCLETNKTKNFIELFLWGNDLAWVGLAAGRAEEENGGEWSSWGETRLENLYAVWLGLALDISCNCSMVKSAYEASDWSGQCVSLVSVAWSD